MNDHDEWYVDRFQQSVKVFAVHSSEAEHPSGTRCMHDCERVVQVFRHDGRLLYELCEVNAEALARMIMDSLQQ